VYNANFRAVKVRLADQPWGPWSEPVTWFDCQPLAGEYYPFCYSSAMHNELTPADGSKIYVTFANPEPYDVTLVELRLGVAVHAWTRDGEPIRYAPNAPDSSYTDAGVAFYASDAPMTGLTPIFETSLGAQSHGPAAPALDATPVFYAYAAPSAGPIHTRPVYRWEKDGQEILDAAERDGWVRGDIAFYVPCIDLITSTSVAVCAP
jgi:hypothetical protein